MSRGVPGNSLSEMLCELFARHGARSAAHFVRGGAVGAGNRDAVQPKIDAELRAVVDHVIQPPFAKDLCARAVDDGLTLPLHFPVMGEVVAASVFDGRAGVGQIAIETGEHVGLRFALPSVCEYGAVGLGKGKDVLFYDVAAPFREVADVPGEAAELHRLFVRFPRELVVGDKGEELASRGEFFVELRKEFLGVSHVWMLS
jgi:hypothetical protein